MGRLGLRAGAAGLALVAVAALGFAVTAVARAGVFAATDLAAVPRAAFGAVRAVALPGLPPALGRAFAGRLLAVPPLRVGLAGVDGAWVDRAGADRAGAAARLAGALAGVARLVAGLPVPRGLAAARGALVAAVLDAAVLDAGALVAGALVAGAALGVLAGAAAPRAAVLAGAAFLAAVPAGFAADRAATGFAGAAARAVLPDVAVRAGLAAAVPRVVFAAVAFGAAAFDGVVLDVEAFDAVAFEVVVFELVVFVAPARVVFGAAVERPGLAVPAARAGLVAALRADPVARGPAALLRRVSSGVLGVRAMAASCLGFSLRCIAGQGGGASAECPRAA